MHLPLAARFFAGMPWLKNVIIDIVVTVLIVLAVMTQWEWAWWIVVIYTPIMLLLKIVALFGAGTIRQFRSKGAEPPVWFLHVLYGVNVLVLGLAAWWLLFAGWVAIWMLSVVQERRG